MTDPAAWLLKQVAADEDAAQDWHLWSCGYGHPDFDKFAYACDCGVPGQRLAECEAKRRIVEEHEDIGDPAAPIDDEHYHSCMCRDGVWGYPCATMRHMLAVYNTRPGWQKEWAPDE